MGDLIQNNIFLVFPSWSKLLDFPTLGTYIDNSQIPSKLLSDPVIFLGGLEATKKIGDQFLHFVFGVGIYYVKFELAEGGRYILDNRMISGLVLSDFVYDKLVTAKPTAFQNLYDVVANDYIFKVPINMADKSPTQRTFIDGTLMRQVFIPYKEVIMEMIKKIQSDEVFPIHSLLTASLFDYDQILLSVRLNPESMKEYMKPTPGIFRIDYGAERLMHEVFSMDDIGMIAKLVQKLRKTYSTLAFNPIQLNTLIENAAFALESNFPNPKHPPEKPAQRLKASILSTAAENEIITQWPDEIPALKYSVPSSGMAPSEIKGLSDKLYEGPEFKEIDVGDYQGGPKNEMDQFELREFTQKKVPTKPLPDIPTKDITEILEVIQKMVIEDYPILDIGKSIAVARDNIRKITLHTDFMFEMGKWANIYSKKDAGVAFNAREKERFLEIVNTWVKTAKITNYPKIE
ncbi:MAG: hypothetical protein EU530_07245 [Promethearchaeota archaeon]|nr:MAG: hypothetical protein EU530_07245 [Candidatus Lokiarchaeota archaeon]